MLEHPARMRRIVRGDQSDLHRPEPDRIPPPSIWSKAIARPMCLSARTSADFIKGTPGQASPRSRCSDKAPVLLPIITKAEFVDRPCSGRCGSGPEIFREVTGNPMSRFELPENWSFEGAALDGEGT